MNSRPRVAIESPYAGDVEANEAFAEAVCRWAVLAGYNPFAMHLHYTRFLDDEDPEERRAGIECGLQWTDDADEVWFCRRPIDAELTRGMALAQQRNRQIAREGRERRVRQLTFTQDGRLIDGWEGPGPDVASTLLAPTQSHAR